MQFGETDSMSLENGEWIPFRQKYDFTRLNNSQSLTLFLLYLYLVLNTFNYCVYFILAVEQCKVRFIEREFELNVMTEAKSSLWTE